MCALVKASMHCAIRVWSMLPGCGGCGDAKNRDQGVTRTLPLFAVVAGAGPGAPLDDEAPLPGLFFYTWV